MTPTEMIAGMVVMLITLAKDALILALAHVFVVESRRICRRDPAALCARAMRLGGRETR